VDHQSGQARSLAESGKLLVSQAKQLKETMEIYERVSALLVEIGRDSQNNAHEKIEGLVTEGLRTIFSSDLSFHLVPGVRAKTPVIDFTVRSAFKDQVVETNVLEARGGGLAATVGFLLQVILLLLTPGRQQTVIFLDESFSHVSAEYEPLVAEFLGQLVEKTGIQIIMVTHSDAFNEVADTRYRFELVEGATKVKQL
jgi:hypothetical protein